VQTVARRIRLRSRPHLAAIARRTDAGACIVAGMRALVGLVVAAGCYRPVATVGAPCSGDGSCPTDQICVSGVCVLSAGGPELDAASGDGGTGRRWAGPTPVPGVGSPAVEDDPSWTSDRLTIVFMSTRNGDRDLFIGTRATTAASFVVTPLETLNSTADDGSPEISPDGTTLYFTSDRDRAGNNDVYVASKRDGIWAANPSGDLTSDADDVDVAISPDGLTALVVRAGKTYLATRSVVLVPFGTPVLVPSLAVPGTTVAAPSITNHADAVYLQAGSVRDLHYARRVGDAFSKLVPITELNTAARESGAFILGDESYLLFSQAGEIYETSR
jgi:hypothetical protein